MGVTREARGILVILPPRPSVSDRGEGDQSPAGEAPTRAIQRNAIARRAPQRASGKPAEPAGTDDGRTHSVRIVLGMDMTQGGFLPMRGGSSG
jgi:hypothetical protein